MFKFVVRYTDTISCVYKYESFEMINDAADFCNELPKSANPSIFVEKFVPVRTVKFKEVNDA